MALILVVYYKHHNQNCMMEQSPFNSVKLTNSTLAKLKQSTITFNKQILHILWLTVVWCSSGICYHRQESHLSHLNHGIM